MNQIEKKRKELGWNWARLSVESGLSISTIRNLERYPEGPSPTIRSLIKVCNALGIKVTDFALVYQKQPRVKKCK